MERKIIRLFWSLDVIATEKWLGEMASKGYILEKINFKKSQFVFKEGESISLDYKIGHHKKGVNFISNSLTKNGWETVCIGKRWTIIYNKNEKNSIDMYPERESITKRNKIIKYSIGIFLFYRLFTSYFPAIIIMTILLFLNEPIDFQSNPGAGIGFILSSIINLAILALLIYIIVKVNKSDKKIRMERGIAILKSEKYDKETIRNLKKSKKIIKKFKLAWFYAPDKLEEWLQEMELKGYNLYKVNRLGNRFYFIKGESRLVKYNVDFQNSVKDSYFEINIQDGWELLFTSPSNLTKYTIWAKEYKDEEPVFYSDKSEILKHARKQAILYCGLYIPTVILYSYILYLNLKMDIEFGNGIEKINILFIILILEFGYFAIKTLRYYIRVKKRVK